MNQHIGGGACFYYLFSFPLVGVGKHVYQLERDAFGTWIKSHVGIIPHTIPSMHNFTTWLYNLALAIDENNITYLKTSLFESRVHDNNHAFKNACDDEQSLDISMCVCMCAHMFLFCKNRINGQWTPRMMVQWFWPRLDATRSQVQTLSWIPKVQRVLVFEAWLEVMAPTRHKRF